MRCRRSCEDQAEGIFRGPYLKVRTPFRTVDPTPGSRRSDWLPDGFVPYEHQATAFERLSSPTDGRTPPPRWSPPAPDRARPSASCCPILDHCARSGPRAGPGIKALILYPMNALASDQAGRIAETHRHRDPLLAGVTAGLYVGEAGRHSDDGPRPPHRQARGAPGRPARHPAHQLQDARLPPAAAGGPRPVGGQRARHPPYVVLDEFHTYDGAQGTDVAMLLRRLGATLGMATAGAPARRPPPRWPPRPPSAPGPALWPSCGRFAAQGLRRRLRRRLGRSARPARAPEEACGDHRLPPPDPRRRRRSPTSTTTTMSPPRSAPTPMQRPGTRSTDPRRPRRPAPRAPPDPGGAEHAWATGPARGPTPWPRSCAFAPNWGRPGHDRRGRGGRASAGPVSPPAVGRPAAPGRAGSGRCSRSRCSSGSARSLACCAPCRRSRRSAGATPPLRPTRTTTPPLPGSELPGRLLPPLRHVGLDGAGLGDQRRTRHQPRHHLPRLPCTRSPLVRTHDARPPRRRRAPLVLAAATAASSTSPTTTPCPCWSSPPRTTPEPTGAPAAASGTRSASSVWRWPASPRSRSTPCSPPRHLDDERTQAPGLHRLGAGRLAPGRRSSAAEPIASTCAPCWPASSERDEEVTARRPGRPPPGRSRDRPRPVRTGAARPGPPLALSAPSGPTTRPRARSSSSGSGSGSRSTSSSGSGPGSAGPSSCRGPRPPRCGSPTSTSSAA